MDKLRGPRGGITKEERSKPQPEDLVSVLIGMLLGDANLQRQTAKGNTRLRFYHGIAQSDLIFHLYGLFSSFIDTPPQTETRRAHGAFKEREAIWVQTLAYTCFNFYHDQFYVKPSDGNFIKIIPATIGQYQNTQALAYWVMSDGLWEGSGLILCTDSFTKVEVEFQIKVQEDKFSLACTQRTIPNSNRPNEFYYRIYIKKHSMSTLINLVSPYILPSLRYKLGQ